MFISVRLQIDTTQEALGKSTVADLAWSIGEGHFCSKWRGLQNALQREWLSENFPEFHILLKILTALLVITAGPAKLKILEYSKSLKLLCNKLGLTCKLFILMKFARKVKQSHVLLWKIILTFINS